MDILKTGKLEIVYSCFTMNVNPGFKIPNGSLIEGVPIKYHMKSLIGGYPHKLYNKPWIINLGLTLHDVTVSG